MTASESHARPWAPAILLVAGLLVLVGISGASIYFVSRAREDAKWVVHSIEVENQISVALLQIRRAESAERGFLITAQSEYLQDFDQAKSLIVPAFETLRTLTRDNVSQQTALDAIFPLVRKRLAEFDSVNALTKEGKVEEGRAIVRQSVVSRTTERIRDLCNEMQVVEQQLFQDRTEAADASQKIAAVVTTAGSGIVLALTLLSAVLVRRSNTARETAERQLREANANLEEAVEERTASLREANEEIQRFAYIVSHDLRSPLVNIMGFTSELENFRTILVERLAELERAAGNGAATAPEEADVLVARDKVLLSDFDEAISFIKASIDKMDRLIGAILKLTREGRREFHPEPLDVGELITGVVATVSHQTTEADATIDIQPLPNLTSDRLALEQIFSNLIDNALKYLKGGEPGHITVKGRRKLGYLVYEVIDNGRGIDPKDHQRIFDLFRRAGQQDRPGQGIGLAHVRALVRRLGGTLSVSSELGRGSTFTVTLPAQWKFGSEGKILEEKTRS